MPWCLRCDRYLTPPAVRTDGTCPSCGQLVDAGRAHTARTDEAAATEEAPPVPWHLKLLLVALAIYLGYRLFQGVVWVVAHV